MEEEISRPTRKLNRYNSKRYKPGLFWCWKCDRSLVGHGQKCTVCGAAKGKRTLKKADILT
jgi:hypothetical protein